MLASLLLAPIHDCPELETFINKSSIVSSHNVCFHLQHRFSMTPSLKAWLFWESWKNSNPTKLLSCFRQYRNSYTRADQRSMYMCSVSIWHLITFSHDSTSEGKLTSLEHTWSFSVYLTYNRSNLVVFYTKQQSNLVNVHYFF